MSSLNPIRLLPVCFLMAALATLAQAPNGQMPASPSVLGSSSVPTPSAIFPASPGDVPAMPTVEQAPPPPRIPLTPEQEGDLMQVQKRYQVAIADYKKIQPPTAPVWNKMGIAYQMMFNLKDAQRCYKASLKLDSKNATTMNNLATTYDSMKKYKNAEKMYRKALKIAPYSAIIYKNLGTNLLTQHKYDKGLDAYKKAMALDPQIFQDKDSPRVSNPANVQERGAMNYYMALGCLHSGQTECTLQFLRNALNEGFVTVKKLATDDQFLSLRDNPLFQQMLADQQQKQSQEKQ